MKRFAYLYLVLLAATLGLCNNATAVVTPTTITIDPGTGGTSFWEKTFTFDDLNGYDISTDLGALEFVFSDSKFITITMNDDVNFSADLTLTFSQPIVDGGFVPATAASLKNETESEYSDFSGSAGSGNGDTDTYKPDWYTWDSPALDGFVFSSVLFHNIRFRDYPAGTTIVSASLKLQVWGSAHNSTMEVGPSADFPWAIYMPVLLKMGIE